jgi:CheY-like chemotaxis protein
MAEHPLRTVTSLPGLELIAQIADELPVAVWVVSAPGGGLLYANRAFAALFGTGARADVSAARCAEVYGIRTRDGRVYPDGSLPFARVVGERAAVCVDDMVIHRPDGQCAFVRALGQPAFDAAGNVVRVTTAFVDVAPAAQAEPRLDEALADDRPRARVLIIDDDPKLARSIKALLEDAHDVEVETSAVRACARLLVEEPFDVVFCDLMMSDMTGMDLYDKVKATRPAEAGRIVFMTGGAFTARARAFLASVDNDCLDKPFVRADLLGVIASRLAERSEKGGSSEERAPPSTGGIG